MDVLVLKLDPLLNGVFLGSLLKSAATLFHLMRSRTALIRSPPGPVPVLGSSQTPSSSSVGAWNEVKQCQVPSISENGDYSADMEPVV